MAVNSELTMNEQNGVAYGLVQEINQKLEERDVNQGNIHLEVDIRRNGSETTLSYTISTRDFYEEIGEPFEVDGEYQFQSEEFVGDEIIEDMVEDNFFDSETTVNGYLEE